MAEEISLIISEIDFKNLSQIWWGLVKWEGEDKIN